MKPALHLVACPHCGGTDHAGSAHRDLGDALAQVDAAIVKRDWVQARMWTGVARKIAREGGR